MRRSYRNTTLLIILLLIGLVVGDIFGGLLGEHIPFFAYGRKLGLSTTTLDLGIMSLTLGFQINLNFAGALGLIFAILLYQKM